MTKLGGNESPNAATITAAIGALLFLLGTIVHPARDSAGVAAAGDLYGLTHAVQALGLLLQAVGLTGMVSRIPIGEHGRWVWYAALIGTLAWLCLIVYDGAANPVMARYAPHLVHAPGGLDPGVAAIVLPALILFPFGYVALGAALARSGRRWSGLLLGLGAVIYTIGGIFIFALGPNSRLIQIFEVVGAAMYAGGFLVFGFGGNAGSSAATNMTKR
jgi:hypothetical protein